MTRLYRPHIPLAVRVKVADKQLRQRGLGTVADAIAEQTDTWGEQLKLLLLSLAAAMTCEVTDLRLDHDPPLGARQRLESSSAVKPTYIPGANDSDHLFYRPHGPQFEGSHDIKTRIRGDHGQHSDIVLIKRERRRQKAAAESQRKKPKFKSRKKPWPKRPFPKRRTP